MNTYEVKIYRNGEYVDTQIVQAEDEWKAKTAAMAFTKVRFAGAAASYEAKQLTTTVDVR